MFPLQTGPSTEQVVPFEEQLRSFIPLIERITSRWRQGQDEAFADDLRQTARIACWRAVETYDPHRNKSLFNYCYCCAFRAARDATYAYRRCHENIVPLEEALHNGYSFTSFHEPATESVPNREPDILLDRIEDDDLHCACERLHPDDKLILGWCYCGQETDGQIAARLGMQPAAVKKRRQRAVQHLRQWLSQSADLHRSYCQFNLAK